MNPWIVLLALIALALLFVVAPVAAATFAHWRRPRRLVCPEEGTTARVTVDARRAALGEALGRPALEVARCSFWPRLRFCRQECLAAPVREVPPEPPAPPAGRRGVPIKTILVPLDGSAGSESVLWTVGELARVQGARVRLLRVAAAAPVVRAADQRVVAFADQETARVEHEEVAYLKQAARGLEGIPVETVIRFGDPAAEIVSEAEASGADLVAMATHQRSGVGRVLKGSVAERVERATTVPVVLVPYGEPALAEDRA
ncbi:MAG: universal stress protein [Candidatus Rokubacteria bacterium]|nr:universal stress protein [Candidatus Rokubacteria bacterium]